MKIIEHWKNSIEPCVRILFIGIGLNLILLPIKVFHVEAVRQEIGILLTVIYLVTVVPFLTAKWIRTCGFSLNRKMCDGGMNTAAQAKQEALDL